MTQSDKTTTKVISLVSRRPVSENLLIQRALDHWETLRAGRLVPKRSALDPQKLGSALGYSFVLEQGHDDILRFRLTGSLLCDCMGMELRGMPAYAMMAPEARERFTDALHAALTTPEIIDMGLFPKTRMIILPMCDEEGAVNRLLGCIGISAHMQSFPTRFTIQSIRTKRIVTSGAIPKPPLQELAETQEHYQMMKPVKRPPQLRLVK